MLPDKVKERLCAYDSRNPNNVLSEWVNSPYQEARCFCDNCFYGRTELAKALLEALSDLKDARDEIENRNLYDYEG